MTSNGFWGSIAGYFHNRIKDYDLFPQNIQFTYKGKDKFTTFFGGIVSIFILGLWFTYGVSLFIVLINRGDSSKSISTEHRDLGQDDTIVKPYEKGFRLAVSLLNNNFIPVLPDPRYFTFDFIQVSYKIVNGVLDITPTRLGYEPCDVEKEFGNIDKDFTTFDKFGLWCPSNTDYHVAGNVECKL